MPARIPDQPRAGTPEYSRLQREKYPDRQRAYRQKHYAKHREAIIARATEGCRKRYQKNRDLVNSWKSQPCVDCGVQYPPYVMDLDHVRGEKLREVSAMKYTPQKTVLAEMMKCDVVCSNCHRVRTHERRIARRTAVSQ